MEEFAAALGVFLFVVVIIGIFAYFLPAIIAFTRNHDHKWAIFFINLLLGWTVIGYFVPLVWSFASSSKNNQPVNVVVSPSISGATTEDSKKIGTNDMYSQLEKIAQLKENGAIDETEFQSMKRDILARHGK
jgi:hypothetical protein